MNEDPLFPYQALFLKYTGCTDEQATFAGCDDPRPFLGSPGNPLLVEKIEQHAWHTRVYLYSFPGKGFNSVCFEHIPIEEYHGTQIFPPKSV